MNKLMENLTEQNFIFDLEDIIPEYFYEEGGEELPAWSLFTELSFSPYQKYDSNKDRGGDFFPYLTIPNTAPVTHRGCIIDEMSSLESSKWAFFGSFRHGGAV